MKRLLSRFIYLSCSEKGMTLIEISIVATLVVVVIAGAYMINEISLTTYQRSMNQTLATRDARYVVNMISDELKAAIPIENDGNPIEVAKNNELIFYRDKDGDGSFERVRIYTSGSNLLKEIKYQDTGSYPVTFTGTPKTQTVIKSLDPSQSQIFKYYNNNEPPQLTSDLNRISSVKISLMTISKISGKERTIQLEETSFIRSKSEILN